MFAQARIGMNDIYVTAFIVAAWYSSWRRTGRAAAPSSTCSSPASSWGSPRVEVGGRVPLAGVFVASVAVTAFAYERGRPGTGGPLDLFAGAAATPRCSSDRSR